MPKLVKGVEYGGVWYTMQGHAHYVQGKSYTQRSANACQLLKQEKELEKWYKERYNFKEGLWGV